MRPPWLGGETRAVGVAFLGLALAVAVRNGAVPFHIPAAHLSSNAIPMAPALLLVWIPTGLAALVLTWSPLAFGVQSDWMTAGIAAIQLVAVATILLGAFAALVHDQLEEVAVYSIVADSGFILLALAARSEAAAEPARLWLLIFIAAKTGLVAWVAATSRAFGTSQLGNLRGWLRRTPLLGLCLVAIAVATLGWPGSEVARVRGDLVRLGLPGELGFLTGLSALLSITYFARLILIGVLPATQTVRESWSERPRFGFGPRAAADGTATGTTATDATSIPGMALAPALASAGYVDPAPASNGAAALALAAATLTDPTAAAAGATVPTAPTRKRRSRAAAASGEGMPTVSAEPSSIAHVSTAAAVVEPVDKALAKPLPANSSHAEASHAEAADLAPARPKAPGMSIRHRIALVWRLNRTLEVSLVVLLAAGLSLAVAAGSFGVSSAAQAGLPLGTAAHATATATPAPSLPPTQAPLATGTPAATSQPSGSGPTATPAPLLTPGRTSGPASPVIK